MLDLIIKIKNFFINLIARLKELCEIIDINKIFLQITHIFDYLYNNFTIIFKDLHDFELMEIFVQSFMKIVKTLNLIYETYNEAYNIVTNKEIFYEFLLRSTSTIKNPHFIESLIKLIFYLILVNVLQKLVSFIIINIINKWPTLSNNHIKSLIIMFIITYLSIAISMFIYFFLP